MAHRIGCGMTTVGLKMAVVVQVMCVVCVCVVCVCGVCVCGGSHLYVKVCYVCCMWWLGLYKCGYRTRTLLYIALHNQLTLCFEP